MLKTSDLNRRRGKSVWETELPDEACVKCTEGSTTGSSTSSSSMQSEHYTHSVQSPSDNKITSGFLTSENDAETDRIVQAIDSILSNIQLLSSLQYTSSYWESCYKFVQSVRNKNPMFLSEKQRNWLEDIKIGLIIEHEKREAKLAWEGHDIKKAEIAFNRMLSSSVSSGRISSC